MDPAARERAPLRPLAWMAAALGTGLALGFAQAEARSWPPLALAALLLALALLARRVSALRGAAPPVWTPWLLVLGLWRGSAVAVPVSVEGASALAISEARSAPVCGTWRARGDGRSGWVEPFPGMPAAPGHALLLEPEAGPPPAGTPVAVLPGGEVWAWPRGPSGPVSERTRRFAGLSRVALDELVRLGPAPSDSLAPLRELLTRMRAFFGARVASLERETTAGLLRALLTGERDDLAPERVDLFARTGTSHLLAISGWHVGLFGALVFVPLMRRARRGRARGAGLAVGASFLALFVALTGGEKPVLRAALALLLAELALRQDREPRRPDALSFLGAAFLLEALLDPEGLRSLSLLLSYSATLGLLVGTGPLLAALRRRERGGPALSPSLAQRALSILAARGARFVASALAASTCAVLATLPITWAAFHETSPWGVVLTALVLPPFTALCLCSWVGALWPAAWMAYPAELCARFMYGLLELGDALPATPLVLPPRPFALLALAVVLAFLALDRARWRRAAFLVAGGVLLPWSAAPRGLDLWALDVGHGTAVVARAPGLEALVFDAGSRDRRGLVGEALVPLLARWDVARPLTVLSHGHRDHAGGLERLAQRFPLLGLYGAAPAQGRVRLAHGSVRMDVERGRIELSRPCPELQLGLVRGFPGPGNEGSRALVLEWRGASLVLLGDAEREGLEWLCGGPGAPVRLLLAPHHGSEAPGLAALLDRTRPEEVWVSGSSPPAIGAELDRRGIPWRWTARDGPLALRLR